ncbi:MAG TPA: hypothetical protein VJ870_07330 [Amycolatopsis sp.]|nr:hypothetical protein [Amycolatopsis sp.]
MFAVNLPVHGDVEPHGRRIREVRIVGRAVGLFVCGRVDVGQ